MNYDHERNKFIIKLDGGSFSIVYKTKNEDLKKIYSSYPLANCLLIFSNITNNVNDLNDLRTK